MKCNNPPMFRYTWPGKDEDYICERCGRKLLQVAMALGLHLQFIPLTAEEERHGNVCGQVLKEE